MSKTYTEKDLRKRMKEKYPGQLLWIEHAQGGTPGLMDCILIDSGKSTFIELKCGDVSLMNDSLVDNDGTVLGSWVPELRPAQIVVMKMMLAKQVQTNVVVIDRTTGRCFIAGSREILVAINEQTSVMMNEVFVDKDDGECSKFHII